MTDIVDELRDWAQAADETRASLMRDAADEIERLRDWLEMASAVLRYSAIASIAEELLSEESDEEEN